MNERKIALEKAGYQFIIDETDSKDPEGQIDTFFRVSVEKDGDMLGTRSESTPEKALARAVELAEVHQNNPMRAEERTLAT